MAVRRIKLIVTGDCEKKSLHTSLAKAFPSTTQDGDEVVWDVPRRSNGATSSRIRAGAEPSRPMVDLVDAMFAEVLSPKYIDGVIPDLILVVDDVELANVGQETLIVDSFLLAVKNKLQRLQGELPAAQFQKVENRLKERCAFHLLKPMIESYFFADLATLEVCGVPLTSDPCLQHPTDVESFDASADANQKWKSACSEEDEKKRRENITWWRTELHPKRYLDHYLTINGAKAYQETILGAKMVEATDWRSIAKKETDAPVISSLLTDILDWYGIPAPEGEFLGRTSSVTYKVTLVNPDLRTLRNF